MYNVWHSPSSSAVCYEFPRSLILPPKGDGKVPGQDAEELGVRLRHILLRTKYTDSLEMMSSLPAPPSSIGPLHPLAPGWLPAPRCPGAPVGCDGHLLPPIGPTWHCLPQPASRGADFICSEMSLHLVCVPACWHSLKAAVIIFTYISSMQHRAITE